MQDIFNALKAANQVGNEVSSMQSPEVDEAVLAQAIEGAANASDVVLELYQSGGDEDIRKYTVAELQAAERKGEDTWRLTTGEILWVY